jgi:hypothetical protein
VPPLRGRNQIGNGAGVSFGGILALPLLTFFAGEAVQRR